MGSELRQSAAAPDMSLLTEKGPAPQVDDRYGMTLDQFLEHLCGLALGGVTALTRPEFEQAFADGDGLEEKRLAAINLGEGCSCLALPVSRRRLTPYSPGVGTARMCAPPPPRLSEPDARRHIRR